MPPHPFNASLCHVINAGLENIRRLNEEGRAGDVATEAEHLLEVGRILSRYCLYEGTPRYDGAVFEQYWRINRLAYKSKIDEASLEQMMIAWEFLAPNHDVFQREESNPFWENWRKRHPNMQKAAQHVPRVGLLIRVDARFQNVRLILSASDDGCLLVDGYVDSEDALNDLRYVVEKSNPPVLTKFAVVVIPGSMDRQ